MIHLFKDTYLSADDKQFYMFDLKTSLTGKKKGEKYETNHKYYPHLDFLFKKLFSNMIMDELASEDIDTLERLEDRYMKLSKHVKKISSGIGSTKNLMEKLQSTEIESIEQD